jgi:chromosome segregation ATPase
VVDISDIQAFSRRTGVDGRGFAFLSDKQGADELVDTTLKAWDKLEAYEATIDKAKQTLTQAQGDLSKAQGSLSGARTRLANLEAQLAKLDPTSDPDGKQAASLRAAILGARSAVSQAESQLSAAQGRFSTAESALRQLESGKLGFQQQLMDRLGLDSSRLTQEVDIRAERDWTDFRPTNALEEWTKIVHTGMGKRDSRGEDVQGEKATGKDALESFMRYGQWNFNQMIKDFTDKLLKAISRASAGKGFSFTDNS